MTAAAVAVGLVAVEPAFAVVAALIAKTAVVHSRRLRGVTRRGSMGDPVGMTALRRSGNTLLALALGAYAPVSTSRTRALQEMAAARLVPPRGRRPAGPPATPPSTAR